MLLRRRHRRGLAPESESFAECATPEIQFKEVNPVQRIAALIVLSLVAVQDCDVAAGAVVRTFSVLHLGPKVECLRVATEFDEDGVCSFYFPGKKVGHG